MQEQQHAWRAWSLGFRRTLHFPYTCNDTWKHSALVRLHQIRLPLLQPSVAAMIGYGYGHPQPTNIAAHFLQPPAQTLEAQTKPAPIALAAQMNSKLCAQICACYTVCVRGLGRANCELLRKPKCHCDHLQPKRQTHPNRPSCQLPTSNPISHRPTARKVSRCLKHREIQCGSSLRHFASYRYPSRG